MQGKKGSKRIEMIIKIVNEFKLTVVHFARPNPMQICACAWISLWTKKLWKIRSGPPGLQAVAGLLLAKPLLFGSCHLSEFTLAGPQVWPLKVRLFCSQGIKGVMKTKTLKN